MPNNVNMTDHQKEVICKIIYAVETGGQVYGNCRYDDFTEAYANTSNETAITIGAGQWYANEAKRLLQLIKDTDPATFKKLDTEGIGADLAKNWSNYRLSKSSDKAKCIQKIINSTVGRKCQDKLVADQMDTYMEEAYTLGVRDVAGMMMCANFRHQGGYGAMKRVIGKTAKPYTLETLYAAVCTDNVPNQVGMYKSRQKFVYENLKKYIVNYKDNSNIVVEEVWKATGTKVCNKETTNVYKTAVKDIIIGQIKLNNRVEVNGRVAGPYTKVNVTNGIGIGWVLTSDLQDKEVVVDKNTKPSAEDVKVDLSAISAINLSKIKTAQKTINRVYDYGINEDGDWNKKCRIAYIKVIQKSLNDQYDEGLAVDGEMGPKTKAAMKRHIIIPGTKGEYVRALQIGLYAHMISLVGGIDKSFGASTGRGVIAFKKQMNEKYDTSFVETSNKATYNVMKYLVEK